MGLVFTNDMCTGCNKCIRECPVIVSNVAVNAGKVMVDAEKCIACGACFDACAHGAREYNDDTKAFLMIWQQERRYRLSLHRRFLRIIRRNISGFLGI